MHSLGWTLAVPGRHREPRKSLNIEIGLGSGIERLVHYCSNMEFRIETLSGLNRVFKYLLISVCSSLTAVNALKYESGSGQHILEMIW